MNDLLSHDGSHQDSSPSHSIRISPTNDEKFFKDVDAAKEDLRELDRLCGGLRSSHEQSKTLHKAAAVKDLRARMDADVAAALKTAKRVKARLEELDRNNEVNRREPGCGPGSSSDRQRIAVVNALRKTMKDSMDDFNRLREKISEEYRETVQRRYFTVTGENPDEKTLDRLISTGESETFLQKAIQEQGRGRILDTINEIQERHDAVKDIEKSLNELHQVFLDMAVLVEHQGQQLDNIEDHVKRADSLVRTGADRLARARFYQKNTRKWTCFAILLLLLIVALVVIFTLRPWENNGGGGGGGGGGAARAAPVAGQSPPSPPPPPPVSRRLLMF